MAVAKRVLFINFLIVGCFFLLTFSVLSTTIRVPADQPTIPDGINAANNGDTVLVADGVYPGQNVSIVNSIYLVSENGPDVTIIEGGSRGFLIKEKVTIEGFKFRNIAQGVLVQYDSATVINCHFRATINGVIINFADAVVENCIFFANLGSPLNILGNGSSATVTGSSFFGNDVNYVIWVLKSDYVSLINNTIIGNGGVAIKISNSLNTLISNCLIAYNSNSIISVCDTPVTFNIECCNIFGNAGGDWTDCFAGDLGINGNIFADPEICNLLLGQLQLLESSPCQPDSSACGLIGALGVGCGMALVTPPIALTPIAVPVNDSGYVTALHPTISWTYYDSAATVQTQYEVDFYYWSSGIVSSSDTFCQYAGPALHLNENVNFRIRLNNGSGFGDWQEGSFITLIPPLTRRVPLEHPTINDAVIHSQEYDTILVADGIYSGEGNKNIRVWITRNLLIKSENGPATTIIDCEGSGRAFEFGRWRRIVDTTVVLEGFTIKNGYSDGAGGAIIAAFGLPNISNCVFENNQAQYGGAIYYNGLNAAIPIARLRGLTFYNNSAELGGAIYYQNGIEELTIENSIFVNNVCTDSGPPVDNYLPESPTVELYCTNIYGNIAGDWVGKIADQKDTNGNMSFDPMFCDVTNGVFTIDSLSSCSPYHTLNSCNELIGALGVGCTNCGADGDADLVCDGIDNCVGVSNPDQTDTDNDGIGDACCCTGNRGDFNDDGNDANILDLTFLVDYIFRGGDMASCPNEADLNSDSGSGNILDLTYLVDFIFRGGEAPSVCPS